MKKVISVTKGDGIGIEVVNEGIKILNTISEFTEFEFEFKEAPAGAGVFKEHGTPLLESSLETIKNSDALLFGAIGLPDVAPGIAERATFIIRQSLDLYVNLRPIKLYDVVRDRCPLKDEHIGDGIDISFIRENTEGPYVNGWMSHRNNIAQSFFLCTRDATEKIIKYAFEFAKRKGHKTVTSVDKANVMEASRFWRQIFHEVAPNYADLKTNDMYMDAFSYWLIKAPYKFEIIVTDNLYGDIVTDQAAMLIGSLGMAPSANLNPGKVSMYEPIHGSAPDIAGQNIANPVATVLSVKLMMEESFGSLDLANQIEFSIEEALKEGRTVDMQHPDLKTMSTQEMGTLISEKLKEKLKK